MRLKWNKKPCRLINYGMSQIDYSEFYIKFSSHSNKTKKESNSSEAPTRPEKTKRVKKKRSAVFSVVMILVCFALTFLLAGILNRETLSSVFGKDENYFAYALVSEVKEGGEKGLNELSKFVRAGGGGGNVILRNEKYYVVHAVYFNKKDAETVQSRDKSSEIFGLKEKSFTTDYDLLKPYAERYNDEKRNAARSLYEAIIENVKTDDNDASIKEILKMKNPFMKLKEEILSDRELESNRTLSIIVAIDTILGRLESLTTASASRISLISDMRYQLFVICTDA